jgi:hypothetical protein
VTRLALALAGVLWSPVAAHAAPSWPTCTERMKAAQADLKKQGIGTELTTEHDRLTLTVTFEPDIYYWSASIQTGKHASSSTDHDGWHEYRETGAPDEIRTMPLSQRRHVGEREASVVAVYPQSVSLERDKMHDAAKREAFWKSARAALDDCLRAP